MITIERYDAHDIMKSFVHGVPTIVRKAVRAEVVKNIYTSAQIYHAFTAADIPGGGKLLLEAGGIRLTRTHITNYKRKIMDEKAKAACERREETANTSFPYAG
ncbi:Protein of unknown function [Pyronema omphalodes CBS 100304]|uniref:Uncharacterized protein n=1 Tax=Pyronema omphalodes (strain CBS 100304) TaxID=1076935 RepID=U4LBG3_PYROM|nr:Protein of unknown function [Pyronema omphalodes CBS 100304]